MHRLDSRRVVDVRHCGNVGARDIELFDAEKALLFGGHPSLNINLARLLHGGQEFVFHGPPPKAGDVISTESWIDKVYEKEGKRGGSMRFAEMVTEYKDQNGKVVAESRTTMIETGKPATEGS